MDYSDDDGMLNIESGEENLYIDHTSEADYGMEEDMHNDSTSKRDQISYIVLKEEDIREHQKTDIKQISTVLSINQVEAIILLLHYQWSSSKVEDEWFTSEERVRKTVGMLKEHMVDVMDRREAECLVLVSDDSGFAEVLWEAKERCLRTVVIGDLSEGKLKRVADVAYSWKEVVMGKAKKEVEKVVGKWRDRDVLKTLEWSYDPVLEKERGYACGDWDYGFDSDDDDEVEVESGAEMGDGGDWWEMDDEDGAGSSRPCR